MITFKRVNIFPTQVERVLATIPGIAENFLLVLDTAGKRDRLTVEVEADEDLSSRTPAQELGPGIQRALHNELQVKPEIRIRPRTSLPASDGGNTHRIRSQRSR